MLTKEKILTILRANKPLLEKELGVKRIGLFGSYAKGLQSPHSDVDIYLELDGYDYKKILSVLLYLESVIGTEVDLVYKSEHLRPSFLQTLEQETVYA